MPRSVRIAGVVIATLTILAIGLATPVAAAPPPVCHYDPAARVFVCDVVQPGGRGGPPSPDPSGGPVPGCASSWSLVGGVPGADNSRLLADGSVEVLMRDSCTGIAQWVPVGPGSPAAGVVVPPGVLVPPLRDQLVAVLPLPVVRVAPADDPSGLAIAQVPSFFWVDQTVGQWAPISKSAAVPLLSVTATATPVELRVDPGDGSDVVRCPGTPRAFPRGADGLFSGADPASFDGCRVVYHHSSTISSNGRDTWPARVSIEWHLTWVASNGETGDLGVVATSSLRELRVGEIEALITGVGPIPGGT